MATSTSSTTRTTVPDLHSRYPGSFLVEYADKVALGEIVAGHELQIALTGLIRDMDNPAYRFNLKEPHRRIRFIESRCKHSIAPWAGKLFLLMLWEKALIEAMYGFTMLDPETERWLRRFQEVLLLVGRKNGKSSLSAGMANAEFFCGPMGVNVLCASNDYEQSGIVFDEINNMREESRALERVTRKSIKGIFMGNPKHRKTTGKFSFQNKARIRKLSAKAGAKEGRNVDFGIVDEIHEMKDNRLVLPIRQSMSTKDEPLLIEISTEGFVDGYLSERLKEARLVLAGDLERPRWLVWLYTQDSETEVWQDESTWVKSNPGLGEIKRRSFLRQMVEEAKTSTATRAFVLAKDFNVRGSVTALTWLAPEILDQERLFKLEDLRGAIALGGCDLSETTDLCCAKAMIMRPGSDKKYILSKYFIPENQVERSPQEYKDRYRKWAEQERLTICPGNENDFSLITAWYVGLFKSLGIRTFKICLDRWGANYLANELEETGFDTEKVLFDQAHISSPMKHAEADLRAGLVYFNQHPVTRWCLGNVGVKVNSLGLAMPVKLEAAKRIDGAAALILCYYAYATCRSEYLKAIR
jgi:phage terminase large subunit-like protein